MLPILLIWSSAALMWWLIALFLTRRIFQTDPSDTSSNSQKLTLFKPLPLFKTNELPESVRRGLESFIAQLGKNDEILIGAHETNRPSAQSFSDAMRAKYPAARVRVIFRKETDRLPNPKISWQIILAEHAAEGLWLWSDADIIAPPHFLAQARRDYASGRARLWTYPYVIRRVKKAAGMLDALFVNAELYPGVLLLGRLKRVNFALGAAMLFSSRDFYEKVKWPQIGCALADDLVLGRLLQPCVLGNIVLETAPEEESWRAAFSHYLRWQKTIRWHRPDGFAGQLLILPVLGWIAWLAFHPNDIKAWLGLLTVTQIEIFLAALLCCNAGLPLKGKHLPAMEAWVFLRPFVWILCWLPWPVRWGNQRWSKPSQKDSHSSQ
ncbi:MAG: glycosyltransferase [bacterium]